MLSFQSIRLYRKTVLNSFRLNTTTSQQANPIVPITDFSYIQIKGPDSLKYLQGLVTNDVNKFKNNGSKCISSALLSPKVCTTNYHNCYSIVGIFFI
jgi:folate-binding Fe-S cluster repair protein YgfZ